jgi:hypothetical protein
MVSPLDGTAPKQRTEGIIRFYGRAQDTVKRHAGEVTKPQLRGAPGLSAAPAPITCGRACQSTAIHSDLMRKRRAASFEQTVGDVAPPPQWAHKPKSRVNCQFAPAARLKRRRVASI